MLHRLATVVVLVVVLVPVQEKETLVERVVVVPVTPVLVHVTRSYSSAVKKGAYFHRRSLDSYRR